MKNLGMLVYTPNLGPAAYLNNIRSKGDQLLREAREKVKADIAEARAEPEASSESSAEE